MAMSEEAKKAQREYMRKYRAKNREKLNEQAREWRKNNPDKVIKIKERYLENLGKRYEQEGDDEQKRG